MFNTMKRIQPLAHLLSLSSLKAQLFELFSLLLTLTFQILSDLKIPPIVLACFGSTCLSLRNYLTKVIAHLLSHRSQTCSGPNGISVHSDIVVNAAFFAHVLFLIFLYMFRCRIMIK